MARHVDFRHLASYESEIDHLRAWQEHAKAFAPQQVAELLWLEAYPAWHRGNYSQSKRLLDNAVDSLMTSAEVGELRAHLMNDLDTVVGLLGDLRRALEYTEKALSLFRELLGERHPYPATAYANLGGTYSELGDSAAR
jgi:tetratricopeptide (TPR) repeat protein